jgi:hypothetical protein
MHFSFSHYLPRMIRGWYPLVLDRAISWLVYVQVRLKLQDLYLEPPGAQARNSAALAMAESGFGSAGGSAREASSGAAGKVSKSVQYASACVLCGCEAAFPAQYGTELCIVLRRCC